MWEKAAKFQKKMTPSKLEKLSKFKSVRISGSFKANCKIIIVGLKLLHNTAQINWDLSLFLCFLLQATINLVVGYDSPANTSPNLNDQSNADTSHVEAGKKTNKMFKKANSS